MVSRIGFWARKIWGCLLVVGLWIRNPTSLHLNFAAVKGVEYRGMQDGSCSGVQTPSDLSIKAFAENTAWIGIFIVATSNCKLCITMEGFHLINAEALELYFQLYLIIITPLFAVFWKYLIGDKGKIRKGEKVVGRKGTNCKTLPVFLHWLHFLSSKVFLFQVHVD